MKALNYPAWDRLEIADLPKPVPVEGEVLVRVANCGICGSELETFRGRNPRRTPPIVMGHEFCGHIEQAYGTKREWLPGQAVIAHALIHCGRC